MSKEIMSAAVEVDALANLATAPALEHNRLNGKTKIIANLTQKVATLSRTLVDNATDISTLKAKLATKNEKKTGNQDRQREKKPHLNNAGVFIKAEKWFGRDVGA